MHLLTVKDFEMSLGLRSLFIVKDILLLFRIGIEMLMRCSNCEVVRAIEVETGEFAGDQ